MNPPQLLLSIRVGLPPGAPNAKVTDCPTPRLGVESDASPQVGVGDVPVRDIAPVAEVLLFFTVKNPESGLAQIVPLVLHQVTAPVPFASL